MQGFLCSSMLLQTRLDILESVKKNIGSSRSLSRQAELNTTQTGQSFSQEVIYLSEAKRRALDVAYNDFTELAAKERRVAQPADMTLINAYSGDADAIYLAAYRVIRATVANLDNVAS